MSNVTLDSGNVLLNAGSYNYAYISILVLTAVFSYAWYGPSLVDRPYAGLPLIGKEDVKNTKEAKMKWLKSAENLIYNTLKQVRYILCTVYITC